MYRSKGRTLVLLVALAAAAGCSDTPVTTPTEPEPPPVLRLEFFGTLSRNAGATHPFAVTRSGTVYVYLTKSTDTPDELVTEDNPANKVNLGMSLGTWDSLGETCTVVVASDNAVPSDNNATPGTTLVATATQAGNLCARVYDVGNIRAVPVNYTVLVVQS